MNREGTRLLAALASQRMEMGEREWCCGPLPDFRGSPVKAREKMPAEPSPSCAGVMENPASFESPGTAGNGPLDDLLCAVKDCRRCPLAVTRKNFVFGSGNPRAEVMFVGEAPGKDEDEQGLPFVGAAGQKLTRMIEKIHLRRDDVYITNVLKCRPPKNRDPLPSEIEQCEPILLRQIELIRPKIICALGRISGKTLLRTESSLAAMRGKVYDYHGVKLVVTYHPAALLRNPQWTWPAWEDAKFLRREYDGVEIP